MGELPADASGSAAPRADSRALFAAELALAVLALAAAVAALGALPAWSLPWTAGPALFACAALPLIALATPHPADALKLAAFTLALSPPLAACVWGAWHFALDARHALAATAVTFAVLHALAMRRRVKVVGGTRARIAVVAVAAVLAALVALLLLRGNEARFDEFALTRASVALAVDRSIPPLHPWLAGEPWPRAWSADLVAAFTMHALDCAPTIAHALFSLVAAVVVPLLLFFLASSLWIDARRSFVSVWLALFASCLPLAGMYGVALGPFLLPGPASLALALSLGGLCAASHALRHGKAPWILLLALFHGFALLLDFSSAWPAALATVLASLSPWCDPKARPRALLALAVASLPAVWQARALEPATALAEARPAASWLIGGAVWLALGVLGGTLAWRHVARERRVVLALCCAAAACAVSGAVLAPAWTDASRVTSLALFALALPAAALESGWRASPMIWAGRAVCVAAFGFGAFLLLRTSAGHWVMSKSDDELLGETSCALEPISSEASAVDLRAALARLRGDERLRADRAVLLACPVNNPYRKTIDLPKSALAACAGLPLYGDHRSLEALAEPQYQARLEELMQLFRDEGAFDPTLPARLEHSGARAVVVLVREEDRAINPPLQGKLERLGFTRWHDFRGVTLFIGPRAAAARYTEKP